MSDNERMNETAEQQENTDRTFTQAEVDEIVRNRLARERKKKGLDDNSDGDNAGNDREKSLEDRELRLMAREKLFESGMPTSLADVLRYSDEKSLEKAIETIKNLNKNKEAPKAWGQRQSARKTSDSDQIRKAMGLNR